MPVADPADTVATLVDQRASQLAGAINAHIVSTATPAGALQGHVRLSANIAAAQTTSAVFAEENPYIGPTLDRLNETALVLNDEMNGTTSPSPAPVTAPQPPTPLATQPVAAKCTVKTTSNKVLLTAPKGKAKKGAPKVKPGTVTVTVKCNEAGKVRLTATLIQLIGKKPKHGKQKSKSYKLGPVTGSAKAGKALTLTIKLPAAAVTALGKGAGEMVVLTVTDTNANGAGRATTKIAMLRGTR